MAATSAAMTLQLGSILIETIADAMGAKQCLPENRRMCYGLFRDDQARCSRARCARLAGRTQSATVSDGVHTSLEAYLLKSQNTAVGGSWKKFGWIGGRRAVRLRSARGPLRSAPLRRARRLPSPAIIMRSPDPVGQPARPVGRKWRRKPLKQWNPRLKIRSSPPAGARGLRALRSTPNHNSPDAHTSQLARTRNSVNRRRRPVSRPAGRGTRTLSRCMAPPAPGPTLPSFHPASGTRALQLPRPLC